MAVATSTAIALGLAGAATAGNIVSANKQSKAAQAAAKVQETAASDAARRSDTATGNALSYIMQNQRQTNQSYQPYIQTGQNALAKLGAGLGLPPSFHPQSTPPPGPMNGLSSAQPSTQNGSIPGMGQPNQGMGQPNSGAVVTLEAPTGERWTGPEDQAQRFIAKGARRIG